MRLIPFAAAVLLVACAGQEKAPAADSAAVKTAGAAAFSLADAAGKWTYVSKSEHGDTTLVTSEMTASADPAGWSIVLPNRPSMPLKVTVSGDSVITSAGPYESVLRKGVQVTTDAVLRMKDGKLVGTGVAHYSTKGADSVRHLVIEATRKP
jgi:hypothetical protein